MSWLLNMGMAGAALATIIGQIFSGCLVVWYLARRFKTVPLRPHHLRPRLKALTRAASIGAGNCFNQLAMLVTQVVLNNSLTHYGALSAYGEAIPLAVAGIVMKVSQLCFGIIIGISQGSQPLESFNYGARNYDRVRRAYKLALTAGAVVGVVSFLLYQLLPRQILGLFGEGTEEYFYFGVRFFRVFCFFSFANFMQPITSTFFTSLGKPLKGVFLSLTRQVIFLIPLILILPLFWGSTASCSPPPSRISSPCWPPSSWPPPSSAIWQSWRPRENNCNRRKKSRRPARQAEAPPLLQKRRGFYYYSPFPCRSSSRCRYFSRVAMPPRICRWALFSSSTCFTCK